MSAIGLAERLYYLFHRRGDVIRLVSERLAGTETDGEILDFGGGRGRVSRALARSIPARFTVADIDAEALRQAPRGDRFRTVRLVPEARLPFPEESFDAVIVVDVLHHVWSAAVALRALSRLLRPGARLVVVDFDGRRPVTRVFGLAARLSKRACRFWTPGTLMETLSDLGLDVRTEAIDSLRFCVEALRP